MSTLEQEPTTTDGERCPFVRYEDINVPKADGLWHFGNFDALRQASRTHFGDASGHEFWLLTHMKDIRAAFQNPDMFSNSSVTPYDPDPPYKWIPEMLDPPLHTKWRQL